MKKICDIKEEKWRSLMIKTLREISDTVASTLGPKGQTCILYNGGAIPHVTKDGVTVSEFIQFKNPFQEAINKIVKETARKTGEKVGDGTTTSILLACELVLEMMNYSNCSTPEIEEVETSIKKLIKKISENKIDLDLFDSDTIDILKSIIYISSNGDKDITDVISEVLAAIGPDGIIDVKESNNEVTRVDVMEGMLLETNTSSNKTRNLDNPYVALVSNSIDKIHQFKTILNLGHELYRSTGRSLIIIAKDFSSEIQNVVSVNNRTDKTSIFLVESDGFALNMYTILDDMSALLDCKILSLDSSSEFGLQNVQGVHLSKIVRSATISPNQTILQSDVFLTPENLEIRQALIDEIALLRKTGETKVGEIATLKRRLSKFSKSATIYVGGYTDAERLEKRDRVDDAVRALEAAVNGGVVPGGGYMLWKYGSSLDSSIVRKVCSIPAERLSRGIDIDIFEVFAKDMVMDYSTLEVGTAQTLGILDPADVLIKALQQALVIVKLLLNTHAIIIMEDEISR